MSSASISFRQTKRKTLTTGGYGPTIFSQSDIDSAFSNATVTGNVYLSPNAAAFATSAGMLNTGSDLSSVDATILTLLDLGKDIYVGITGLANNLLRFRLVKITGDIQSLGEPVGPTPSTGYVVVESRVSETYSNKLYVSSWLA